ncbi:hypothetical protein [Ulvibacter antarcticus]|uniref:Uncharacterized protein n=1 Tax=Ulvibacter antarcticus TaxID=442714 RepID=A0A3L9YX62_9FLAO|nr:hypothetical protein [Ulvibacter antarcticus]RMA64417.1 hypothetical protein BXY75_1292 [Ulvibacter antarcticus]
MKKLIIVTLLLVCSKIIAQVGIGTTKPSADLHVGGDLLVQDSFYLKSLGTVSPTDENFKLIALNTNSTPAGEVKVLDVDALSVAPVNVINYEFTNISLDNLTDLDLQYDSSKYIVGIANFRYVGDAILKGPDPVTKSIGNFVVRTFESGGTWHLEIKNRTLDLAVGKSVTYHATLIIYDKSYYKHLAPITTDLGGSNSGNASSVPVLE